MKGACLGDDDQACGPAAGVAGQRGERTRRTTHAARVKLRACVVGRVRSPRRPPRAAVKTDRVTGIPLPKLHAPSSLQALHGGPFAKCAVERAVGTHTNV